MHTHTCTHARTLTHTHTYAHTHAHMHTHICTHTHPLLSPLCTVQNADGKLTKDEFREGARKDTSIMQALSLYDGLV